MIPIILRQTLEYSLPCNIPLKQLLRLLLLLDDGPAKHLARIYGEQAHGGLDIGLLLLLRLLLSLEGLLLLRVDYLKLAHGVHPD